ncbi:MAG: hypothetical protein KF747_14550 [Nitrospira sp.]|nr:hypothetical protein [Nitrospira sp.]
MKTDQATRYHRCYEAGMTLIELMIATAVGLGVIGAALSMLVMSQKATTVNEQVGGDTTECQNGDGNAGS